MRPSDHSDVVSHILNTLTGPWSASSVAGMLTVESIGKLVESRKRWDAMDPLVKARLVIAPLFMRKTDLDVIREELGKIQEMAKVDTNEWVSMLGTAVDGYDGRIHTDKVLESISIVNDTLDEVVALAGSIDPMVYRPLEEEYLTDSVLVGMGAPVRGSVTVREGNHGEHAHFKVRDAKDVVVGIEKSAQHSKPLSSGSNGFDRKRDRAGGLVPMDSKKLKSSSLFINNSKPKPLGRPVQSKQPQPPQNKKKAAVLDITAIQQARAVNEQRRKEFEVQKEKEKERLAKERADNALAEKQLKEERKRMMKEAETKKKEMQKQKAKEERGRIAEEAKAAKRKEAVKRKKKPTVEPVDPKDVRAALERAGIKADLRSVGEIQNPDLRSDQTHK